MQPTARSLARDVLLRCERQKQYSNLALDAALKRTDLSDVDRALATALVYGVLEKCITLDYQIDSLSTRKGDEITPEVRTLLHMGIYQMAYLERVPDHAAVHETVELAGKRAAGFVNAVLRAFARRKKEILLPDRTAGEAWYLSVRYSVGQSLVERFLSVFGSARTESILQAIEEKSALTIRINPQKISRDAMLKRLYAEGYTAEPSQVAPHGIRILSNAPVAALPGFSNGWFFVQDEASQICVEAVDARPEMTVLDTCACPGSKSFGMAMNMNNSGRLIACDLHASKLSLITDSAKRLEIDIIQTMERDARAEAEAWYADGGRFDRILCDVPCSGFGVLAKKPELRYKNPAESAALPRIQLDILNRSATFLKAGGRLVYSTCTVLPEENGENVNRFLEQHPAFVRISERTYYPDIDGTDGFFVAVLEKRG